MGVRVILLTVAGLLLLILGIIGIFLPIWPTTPFVLAGVGCLSGTPRLQAYIKQIPFFHEHIENYQNRCGLTRKTVTVSLVFLWGMLILSMFLVGKPWLIALEIIIGLCVTSHIFWIARPKIKSGQ